MRPASSGGSRGTSGTPCRQNMGIDPSVAIRTGEGAHRKWCRELWVFPSSETGMSGNFGGRIKGAKYRFVLQDGTWDFLIRCSGQGPHLAMTGEPRVFLELRRDSRVTTGISGFLLGWPWEARSSPGVARERWGVCSSHYRAKETSSRRVSRT